ncbi:hypothetical protein VTK73DRAFT_396 [Phialemonium thermophilum]|uniref:Uncharacterized protein n=1 Tax=Phialemonium thermophilum TaxID=223376 RepID=A0ABR3XF11_9PEZI
MAAAKCFMSNLDESTSSEYEEHTLLLVECGCTSSHEGTGSSFHSWHQIPPIRYFTFRYESGLCHRDLALEVPSTYHVIFLAPPFPFYHAAEDSLQELPSSEAPPSFRSSIFVRSGRSFSSSLVQLPFLLAVARSICARFLS